MRQELRNKFILNQPRLVAELDVSTSFLALLLSKEVIKEEHKATIQSEKTPHDKADKLIEILGRRPDGIFVLFCEVLKDENSDLANLLNPNEGSTESAALSAMAVSLAEQTGITDPFKPEGTEKLAINSDLKVKKMAKFIQHNEMVEQFSKADVNDTELGSAKFTGYAEQVAVRPTKRQVFNLACPCTSQNGEVKTKGHNWWKCAKCLEILDYAFDQYFYCDCGKTEIKNFTFKCNRLYHGSGFMAFPNGHVKNALKGLKPKEEMNILILGETGVGKSTWINGIVNYMTFPSLDEAREYKPPLSLIGSSFTIMSDDFEEIEIKIGDDKNEVNDPGTSATQSPKAYVFDHKDKRIRLIDTPGIGDTRGIEQDKKNFDMILRYLANLDKLNGICILLKPNNSRLTAMFRFCIKELLTHLHKDAGRNIVFCFTNARSTFYKPGDTMPPLKKLLQESKNVEIKWSNDNVYCMDNEAFRFLCALHCGIKYDENDIKNFSASWDKSVAETNRMFDMIATLKPHRVIYTISLNKAREIILMLTKPMADISQNIQVNIALVKDRKREIEQNKLSLAELEQKLHMHITYEYEEKTQNVLDETTQKLIRSYKSNQEKLEVFIQTLNLQVSNLQKEQLVITEVSAKFGCFLKINAIAPYNDAMAEYLEILIRGERAKVDVGGNRQMLEGMLNMQKAYKEEIEILDRSMNTVGKDSQTLGPEDVRMWVEQLYQLPLNGKSLKEAVEVARAGTSQMVAYNEVLYRPEVTRYQHFKDTAKTYY